MLYPPKFMYNDDAVTMEIITLQKSQMKLHYT